MMNKTTALRILRNGTLFIGLIVVTFYFLLKDQDLPQLAAVLRTVKIRYLLIGAGCMCIFLLCEAINISRSLRLFGYHASLRQTIRYALTGFFFSSVTPSASGGQPMQLYYMHRDHISVSHGALALLMQFSAFQTVTVLFAVIGFFTQYSYLMQHIGNFKYLFLAGISINVLLLFVTLVAIFSRRLSQTLLGGVCRILRALRLKKAAQIEKNMSEQLAVYQSSSVYFRQNKRVMSKIFLFTVVQIAAFYSIPYWIYLSLGLTAQTVLTVVAMQAVLYITVSALPLPGAVGASESGFLLLFQSVFPAAALHDAMLLSRGISFYLFVALSGIAIAFLSLRKVKPMQRHPLPTSASRAKKNSETI